MDWSRCCNSLAQYKDGVHQVGVFERMLRKNHYYSSKHEGPARAIICTWEDTEAWLKDVASKEQANTEKMTSEKPKTQDVEGSGKKDSSTYSTSTQHPQFVIARVDGTAQGPQTGEEKEAVASPGSPHTLPSASPKVEKDSAGDRRKPQTGLHHLKKKVSLSQMLQFFHKKGPPAHLV
jgi:hypothetical protein